MIDKYIIERAQNGWVVRWCIEQDDGTYIKEMRLFSYPDEVNTDMEDPEVLVDLLYFIKEEVCGQYHSKHKKNNAMIRMEGKDGA